MTKQMTDSRIVLENNNHNIIHMPNGSFYKSDFTYFGYVIEGYNQDGTPNGEKYDRLSFDDYMMYGTRIASGSGTEWDARND